MSTSPSDLRGRVDLHLSSLSAVGRRVALLLVDEHDRLGFHSATDIARMAGTSDATVIRTVQQLGYSGILALKADIAAQLIPLTPAQRLETSVASGASPGHELLVDLHDIQVRGLSRLTQPEVRAAIDQAILLIAGAERVFVNAHGLSTGLAIHCVAHLARVGVEAHSLGGPAGVTADDLARIRARDVAVVVSSGLDQRWHRVMYKHCDAVGAQIVLITDNQPAPNAESIVIRVGRGEPAGAASHVATLATIESIALGVASKNQDRTKAALEQLTQLREQLKS